MLIPSALPLKASAMDIDEMVQISDAQIRSPKADGSYKVGKAIPLNIYAGFIVGNRANWIQVAIYKDGKQVYWNCYNYTKTITEYYVGSYTPKSPGTYTIKAGTTNDVVDATPNDKSIRKVSSTVKFKVKASTIKTVKPSLTVTRTAKKKASLKWSAYPGAKAKVYRATSKNGKYKLIKTTSKTSFTDKKLKASKVYYYKVRLTKKEKGKKAYSKYSSKVKAPKFAPFAVKLSNTSKGVKISWGKYTGIKDGYYLIDKGTKSGGEGEVIACCGFNESSYIDKDVQKGKTYYYRVTVWHGNEDKPRAKTKVVKITYK
jgi:hypothetical protein